MKRELADRGVDRRKVAVLKNGVDLAAFRPGSSGEGVRRRLGLEARCVVTYVGTHGLAHGLETVLHCAQKLREVEALHFLFVGEGARKRALIEMARQMGLQNVTFLGQQRREVIPAILAASDLCLVPLRRAELFTTVIPSKMFEIMAAGKPILLAVDGEARDILEEAGAGEFVPPEDPVALGRAILSLWERPEEREAMGRAGRAYVERNMNREALARRYEQVLAGVLAM
jgi:glycosyltransferase involved in cell wall biosynthesis